MPSATRGTPDSTSCIEFTPGAPGGSLTNTQTGAKLMSAFYGGAADTHDGNAGHGSYPASNDKTFRVKLTAAGKSNSFYTIHRTSTNGTATMPAITRSTSASHEVFEIADPSSPVVFISAPGGTNNLKGAVASTAHKGKAQLVVTGLAAGTYAVRLGGVPVPACGTLPVRPREHVLTCPAVPSGAVTVTALGGARPPATMDSRIRR